MKGGRAFFFIPGPSGFGAGRGALFRQRRELKPSKAVPLPGGGRKEVGQEVLPAVPGGSPAGNGRQVNPGAPGPPRNNDLPYISLTVGVRIKNRRATDLRTSLAHRAYDSYNMRERIDSPKDAAGARNELLSILCCSRWHRGAHPPEPTSVGRVRSRPL